MGGRNRRNGQNGLGEKSRTPVRPMKQNAKRVSPANAGRETVSKMFIKAETTPIFLRVKSVKSFD